MEPCKVPLAFCFPLFGVVRLNTLSRGVSSVARVPRPARINMLALLPEP